MQRERESPPHACWQWQFTVVIAMRACVCLISSRYCCIFHPQNSARQEEKNQQRFEDLKKKKKAKQNIACICRQLTDASSSKQCQWVNKGNCKSRPASRLFVVSLYRQHRGSLLFYTTSLSFYFFKSCNWILIFGISASTEEPFFFFLPYVIYLFAIVLFLFVTS